MSKWLEDNAEKFSGWIGAAQHQDNLNKMPKWAKFLHRIFIAWRCPACIHWKKMNMPHSNI